MIFITKFILRKFKFIYIHITKINVMYSYHTYRLICCPTPKQFYFNFKFTGGSSRSNSARKVQ